MAQTPCTCSEEVRQRLPENRNKILIEHFLCEHNKLHTFNHRIGLSAEFSVLGFIVKLSVLDKSPNFLIRLLKQLRVIQEK